MTVQPKDRGMVYNIQRFSIHDGPGIRTTVFLKGCPLRCFWCQNPESQRFQPELFHFADKCIGCGACIPACPKKACLFNDEGVMTVDRTKCIGCGACTRVCPADARSIMGKELTVDEVMAEVRKDRNFYDNSDGGMTVSGGDPIAQPGFTIELLKAAKAEGIHTCIETSAWTSWEVFEQILEYTDLLYMDVKCIDPELHKRCTGVTNEQILDNAVRAAKAGQPMRVRTPVIPNFNDDEAELKKIADFVHTNLPGVEYELLKYNKLCESKYLRLEREFEGEKDVNDAELEKQIGEFRTMVDAIR